MAEVSTIRRFTMEDVGRQWKGACGHAVTVKAPRASIVSW